MTCSTRSVPPASSRACCHDSGFRDQSLAVPNDAGSLRPRTLHVTKRKKSYDRTLRNGNRSERSKFAAFHTSVLTPDVVAREIDRGIDTQKVLENACRVGAFVASHNGATPLLSPEIIQRFNSA